MFSWFEKKQVPHVAGLAELLALPQNREELLGVKEPNLPNPESIRQAAARLVKYSSGADYKTFADEAWSRVINHLDKILDSRSTNELRQYHCGAAQATLDLLRLSFQARTLLDKMDQERQTSSQS